VNVPDAGCVSSDAQNAAGFSFGFLSPKVVVSFIRWSAVGVRIRWRPRRRGPPHHLGVQVKLSGSLKDYDHHVKAHWLALYVDYGRFVLTL